MVLGGFQKNTLIDFPGEVASLVFTQGCNFHCPYCHNPDLVPMAPSRIGDHSGALDGDPKGMKEQDIFSFLEKRKGLIEGVAVTGGEPTLQPGLDAFCFQLKTMGMKVKLDTNGSRPDVLETLLRRRLIDYVAMDIKGDSAGYAELAGSNFDISCLNDSVDLIMTLAPRYEFRTTCVKPFVTEGSMGAMLDLIDGAVCYILQPFHDRDGRLLNDGVFQGKDPACSNFEMQRLQAMAQDRGIPCTIR